MIKDIKEALEKATPGPWKLGPGCIYTNHTGSVNPVCVTPNDDNNGYLIANSPTYIRYLLDELEKAQERVEITNKAMESALGLIRDLENELQGIRNVANDGLKHGDEYRMNISLSSIKMAVDEIFDDEEDAPDEQN